MKKYNILIKEMAVSAGKFLKSRVGKIRKIDYKDDINIVTDVDLRAEKMIVGSIRKNCPGHAILTEEAGKIGEEKYEYRWVIDPLDGTTNFSHGYPFFCVSIALEKKGEIILGAVYEPMRDELFFAEKGKGAYLNNKRINVSSINNLQKSLLVTGFAYNIHKANRNNNINYFRRFLKTAQAVRRDGTAALDLCYVACGRTEGFWEMRLNPWDTAAGYLIVTEAGGKVTDFKGQKFSIFKKEIFATNGSIHQDCLKVIGKK
ncbi:MAG: inositol monophosphatase family protein [bacterium]|nr:inositol monophosphatase family protein [bacterium]